jgi:hypothetical protein
MIGNISWLQSALNFFLHRILIILKLFPNISVSLLYILKLKHLTFCILYLGDPRAPEFYVSTFRNTLNEFYAPKRQHIKFRRRGEEPKKGYNLQNTAKVFKSRL